jgi:hypothetical protein
MQKYADPYYPEIIENEFFDTHSGETVSFESGIFETFDMLRKREQTTNFELDGYNIINDIKQIEIVAKKPLPALALVTKVSPEQAMKNLNLCNYLQAYNINMGDLVDAMTIDPRFIVLPNGKNFVLVNANTTNKDAIIVSDDTRFIIEEQQELCVKDARKHRSDYLLVPTPDVISSNDGLALILRAGNKNISNLASLPRCINLDAHINLNCTRIWLNDLLKLTHLYPHTIQTIFKQCVSLSSFALQNSGIETLYAGTFKNPPQHLTEIELSDNAQLTTIEPDTFELFPNGTIRLEGCPLLTAQSKKNVGKDIAWKTWEQTVQSGIRTLACSLITDKKRNKIAQAICTSASTSGATMAQCCWFYLSKKNINTQSLSVETKIAIVTVVPLIIGGIAGLIGAMTYGCVIKGIDRLTSTDRFKFLLGKGPYFSLKID